MPAPDGATGIRASTRVSAVHRMIQDPNTHAPIGHDARWVVGLALAVVSVVFIFAWTYTLPSSDEASHAVKSHLLEASHLLNAIKLSCAVVGFFTAALGIGKTLHDAFAGRPLTAAGSGALLGLIGALLVVAGSQCLC